MTAKSKIPEKLDEPSARQTRNLKRLFLVFGIALSVRLLHLFALKVSPIFEYKIGDAARYDAWAQTIADGNWIGEGVFYQAPLYPYFLGTIYATLGNSLFTVRFAQAILGSISCVLLMQAGTNLFGRRSGLVTGLCLALYAPSIFLEGLIQKSVLDLFFLSLLLYQLSAILRRPRIGLWIGAGLSTGALCLTRENALVLIPLFLVWILFGAGQRASRAASWPGPPNYRQKFAWGTALMIGLTLTLGPVAVRNFVVGGQFHLTTSQLGPNFYIGNNPEANGTYQPLRPGRGDAIYEQQDAVEIAEAELGRDLTPAEVSRFYLDRSIDFIRRNPAKWVGLLATKFAMTVNRHEIIDTEDQYTVAQWSPILFWTETVFNFGMLFPLGLLGIGLTILRWRKLWVFYLMILLFAATLIAFFVFGRYRFPLAPLLMLFAGPALVHLGAMWKKRDVLRLARWSVAGLLIGICCHLDIFPRRIGEAITLSNYGVQAMIRNDYANAQRFLQASCRKYPESALVHNNLGVLYRETGQLQLARKHLEQAMKLEPADDRIRQNLEKLKSLDESPIRNTTLDSPDR